MTHEINVPYWAAHIKHEGILTWIAFHVLVVKRYGTGQYNYNAGDVNTMLGISLSQHAKWLANLHPELDSHIKIYNMYDGEVAVEMNIPENGKASTGFYKKVTLSDARQIRVWCYLLGTLNRYLLTDKRPGTIHGFLASTFPYMDDTHLFKYSRTNFD